MSTENKNIKITIDPKKNESKNLTSKTNKFKIQQKIDFLYNMY